MRFAVRLTVVARLLSQLFGLLAVLALVPGTVALATGSFVSAGYYGLVIGGMAIVFLAGRRLPVPDEVQRNEALVVVALLFTSASLIMSVPMLSYGMPWIDAWFEAVSAVTTTGLSTVSLEDKPVAFLFARTWLQWVGGIGVVILALAFFIRSGGAAKALGFSKAEMADVVGGTRAHARRVILIYLTITGVGIGLLLICGSSVIDAVAHTFAAVSTGGFANYGDSLASVRGLELAVINGLCIAGAVSFHVYYISLLAVRRGQGLDNQLLVLLGAISLVTLLVWLGTRLSAAPGLPLADVLTVVISAQTTAGFATMPLSEFPAWVVLVLCLVMAVGGGIGSTSGGLKLGRVIHLWRWARDYLERTSVSDRVLTTSADVGGSADGFMADVIAMTTCFVALLMLSWLIFVAYGYPPLDSLFEVTSALGTAGLSIGITSAELPSALKVVLCIDMLLGRVELVAILVLLMPSTWIGRRRRLQRTRLKSPAMQGE